MNLKKKLIRDIVITLSVIESWTHR